MLEWTSTSIKNVTRSTFVSDLQAAIAATDSAIMLALTLHEIVKGPVTPKEGLTLRERGGMNIGLRVCVDAMSVFAAIAVDHIKPPAEKSLLCHLLWLKELVQLGIIREFRWIDTRDMTADGHTKGSVSREALMQLASGHIVRTIGFLIKRYADSL